MPMWLAKLLSTCLSQLEGPVTQGRVYRLDPADWTLDRAEASVRALSRPMLGQALLDRTPAEAPLTAVDV
jgi:hypothetical protein